MHGSFAGSRRFWPVAFRLRHLVCWGARIAILFAAPIAHAQESGSPVRGFDYALMHCAECHAIDVDDFDSPLFEAPSFMEIANSGQMSERALIPFFQTPHEFMPNFVVPADAIRDLTAYILSLKVVEQGGDSPP